MESDVIPTLRNILSDTLDRIRAEVFDIHRNPPANGAEPADSPESAETPGPAETPQPADSPDDQGNPETSAKD